jgi:hypothetical protein
MRSFNKRAAVTVGCLTLALLFVAPTLTRGDEWNLMTRFTVNHPFEVPGMVLQPNTRYVIRLLDSPSNRNIVQVYNEDQTKMLTMFMAISAERLEPTDRTLFSFIETEPGFPLPVKEWFYPGRLHGLEFVYPKGQALEIAAHARGPVLAANAGDLRDLNRITVEAIGPVGTKPAATETATNITKTETTTAVAEEKPSVPESTVAQESSVTQEQKVTEQPSVEQQPVEIAQNTPTEVQQQPAPAATELPATAGELPLVALAGLLCLGAGLGLRVISAKL